MKCYTIMCIHSYFLFYNIFIPWTQGYSMNTQSIKLFPSEIFPQEMTDNKASTNGVYKHNLISISEIVSIPTLLQNLFILCI